jgi:hypothetical protein
VDESISDDYARQKFIADVLRTIPVYTDIPAGGFSASPRPDTWAEIEQVMIDNIPYHVFNLNQGRDVHLRYNEYYVMVKVKGDSMNKKKIDNGDYVILHVQQDAKNGDIVAAEIDGKFPDDEKSTLKQFFRRNEKVYLEPQSNNAVHKPFVFTNENSLHIRGVAVAVLKPV